MYKYILTHTSYEGNFMLGQSKPKVFNTKEEGIKQMTKDYIETRNEYPEELIFEEVGSFKDGVCEIHLVNDNCDIFEVWEVEVD